MGRKIIGLPDGKELAEMNRNGSTLTELGKEYDCSFQTIANRIRDSGCVGALPGRCRVLPSANKLVEMLETMSQVEIGKKYDVSPQAVNFQLRQAGHRVRDQQRRDSVKVYEFVEEYYVKYGKAPLLREIRVALSISSSFVLDYLLGELETLGKIERTGKVRGIVLILDS